MPDPRAAVLVVLSLLGTACATTELRTGQSGPVAWEVLDKPRTEAGVGRTLVLRETAGVGIRFTTIQTVVPLPPTGYGKEYYGGIGQGGSSIVSSRTPSSTWTWTRDSAFPSTSTSSSTAWTTRVGTSL